MSLQIGLVIAARDVEILDAIEQTFRGSQGYMWRKKKRLGMNVNYNTTYNLVPYDGYVSRQKVSLLGASVSYI